MATRLRRLKIQRFRDLRPGTELFFNDGWNVLLGRNGSGKTTLLHLISMILRDDFSAAQSEGMQLEYEIASNGGRVVVSITQIPIVQSLPGRSFQSLTSFKAYEPNGQEWGFEFVDGSLASTFGDRKSFMGEWLVSRARMMALHASGMSVGEEGRKMTPIEAWIISQAESSAYRVDEGLATFGAITGVLEANRPSVCQMSRVAVLKGQRKFDPLINKSLLVPAAVTEGICLNRSESRAVAEFNLGGDPILERLLSLLSVIDMNIVAKTIDMDGLPSTIQNFGRFEFYARYTGVRLTHHDHWSFGQQRLLTLFWYLACNPDVLVVDEPVNGLHWEWIEAFAEAIGDRQVFVTAQNPLLLEHVGFDSPQKVQRSFVLCRRDAQGENEREMVWAQPSAEQAESFFRAWSTGVQPVHEVLKTEGLW